MARHTPPKPIDVEAAFPELRPFRGDTVRLHPRQGSPSCRDSSVGGPLLWPADEPWPVCTEEHRHPRTGEPHQAEVSLVPVAQVHRVDAPGIPFPEGRDLLQVLWCPFDHGELGCPLPRVYWRTADGVGSVLPTPAVSVADLEDHVPEACVVHPERVTEYPSWDLPEEVYDALRERFERLERDTGWSYEYHLADAPGIKLGGYPGWTQEPVWPGCASCGGRMEHLLTVSSWEYDGESWRTWLPVEDREGMGEEGPFRSERGRAAQNAAGLMLGDAGGVYVFECRSCPDRPIGHWFDCS